ncbi:MAG TPA: redoxin domain-containing protein [Dehalococcoidia bacterium]|nr:redoxin domain-containing protein [Dehalococcoidia bacterium]
MDQVVDLEGSSQFQSLGVTVVSIAIDPVDQLAQAVRSWRVSAPHLSDAGGRVSLGYGVQQWAMPNGEPGHTFVLVGQDGKVRWVRDYGAPVNGGLMYVPVDQLYQEVAPRLAQ